MKKKTLQLISTFLVLVLLANMLPLQIFAENLQTEAAEIMPEAVTEEVTPEEATVVAEITENRTEYSKEFLLSNGLHMAAVYADPVHYETETGWEEIDNTLQTNPDGSYSNTAGIWEVTFPEQLGEDESVMIEKDGYTLSFFVSGELTGSGAMMMSTGLDDAPLQTFGVTQVQPAIGEIQEMDTSANEQAEHPEAVPDKLNAQIAYEEVYANTDIVYDLDSNTVKESMILESYDPDLQGYSYTLEVGAMLPVVGEDGTVTLYDENQEDIVMVMPAPYLIDGNGEHNYDIEVQLAGKGSTYILAYLLPTDWLAEADRAWPVVLDPWIVANLDINNIRDRTVAESAVYDQGQGSNLCGKSGTTGIMRTFIKYSELPTITSSDVVLYAEMQMRKIFNSNTETIVEVHKVNDDSTYTDANGKRITMWDSATITWGNKPSFDPTVEDYLNVYENGRYTWDVTEIVRDWYANKNTGMMFKASDTVENGTTDNFKSFVASDYSNDPTYQPALLIYFRNNNGLESYWDYTASSAGRTGTGYVNNYTGNLVWVREDMGFGGNLMPVSISHIYNLNDSAHNDFGLGYGWRTNYNQRIETKTLSGILYYVWEDADGTKHYFTTKDGKIQDEDGLELTLTTNTNGFAYCITDKQDNRSYFDTKGRLSRIVSNQNDSIYIGITYEDANSFLIKSITDGAKRVYAFDYNNNLLSEIQYKGHGATVLYKLTFSYKESCLTDVIYADSEIQNGSHVNTSRYTYSDKCLVTARDIDGYTLTYTHTRGGSDNWQPYRVQCVEEKDGSAFGGKLTFAYAHNQTKIIDEVREQTHIYQFNDFGNTVSIQDDQGRAQFTQFARTKKDDTGGKANQLELSSKLQSTVVNLARNSSFETTDIPWTSLSATTTISRDRGGYHGAYCLNVENTDTAEHALIGETFSVPAGTSLTFSAYVYVSQGSCRIGLTEYGNGTESRSSKTLTELEKWKRLQVTYTNDTNTAKNFQAILFPGAGSIVQMDCVQVELSASASRYNLVENSDFQHSNAQDVTDYWSGTTGSVKSIGSVPALDGNVYTIQGSPSAKKTITQVIKVGGQINDTFVLAGWAKGDSVPLTGDRTFGIRLKFGTSADDVYDLEFNPDSDEWQYAAKAIVAPHSYTHLTLEITYDYNANTAYFDGIQLYKEEFGSSYTYDEDGNVISVKDLQGKNTTYEYDTNSNLTKIIENNKTKMEYTYDSHHNVLTAKTGTGIVYSFTYDSYGNNTKVSTTTDGKTMSSSATYTSNGNYLDYTTDALGKVTRYGYDTETGVLDWVQYPEDTADTRTEYTYDNMYRTASAACTTNTGLGLSANYTYTDDLLTKIQTPTTAYNFTYGVFDLRTGVKVGNQSLATYTYSTDRKYNLQKLDYGNGDSVQYEYDDQDRIIKQTYEDGTYVSYTYNNDGDLCKVYDSQTGITTSYTYDLTGRLVEYRETGDNHNYSLSYTYNRENQISKVTEILDGHDRESTYEYNTDGQITFFEKVLARRRYSYDAFGRVSSTTTLGQGMDTIYTTDYTFNDTATTVSGQVTALHHQSTYNNAHPYDRTYSYTYDDNGNILSVSDGTNTTTYVYDSANQLIRENNQAGNFTHTWKYDNAGNILERKEYAYTTGSLDGVTPTDTVTYTYGDEDWGDLLTEYDGNTITYDEIGNPLSDGEWNYTWRHGRQLASVSDGETTWTYTYGQNGLRTNRTDGTTNYRYVYDGSQLTFMARNSLYLRFAYTPEGTPLSVLYKGTTYYYVTNLQGDVVAILTGKGYVAVEYTYDAWGNLLSTTGSLANSLGKYNPLRYRGYVYDYETGLYYLQSRYYDPEWGRFINADGFVTTGQGFVGNNMFAYCLNNPINYVDPTGEFVISTLLICVAVGVAVGGAVGGIAGNAYANSKGYTGWDKTSSILTGIGIGGFAGGVLGYFAAPAVISATGIAGISVTANGVSAIAALGTSFGKLGTLIANNGQQIIDWGKTTWHAMQRMFERGVTQKMVEIWVKNGKALQQAGDKILYVTKQGAVVIDKFGKVITAYTSQYFDAAMQEIIEKLFGK